MTCILLLLVPDAEKEVEDDEKFNLGGDITVYASEADFEADMDRKMSEIVKKM